MVVARDDEVDQQAGYSGAQVDVIVDEARHSVDGSCAPEFARNHRPQRIAIARRLVRARSRASGDLTSLVSRRRSEQPQGDRRPEHPQSAILVAQDQERDGDREQQDYAAQRGRCPPSHGGFGAVPTGLCGPNSRTRRKSMKRRAPEDSDQQRRCPPNRIRPIASPRARARLARNGLADDRARRQPGPRDDTAAPDTGSSPTTGGVADPCGRETLPPWGFFFFLFFFFFFFFCSFFLSWCWGVGGGGSLLSLSSWGGPTPRRAEDGDLCSGPNAAEPFTSTVVARLHAGPHSRAGRRVRGHATALGLSRERPGRSRRRARPTVTSRSTPLAAAGSPDLAMQPCRCGPRSEHVSRHGPRAARGPSRPGSSIAERHGHGGGLAFCSSRRSRPRRLRARSAGTSIAEKRPAGGPWGVIPRGPRDRDRRQRLAHVVLLREGGPQLHLHVPRAEPRTPVRPAVRAAYVTARAEGEA